MLLPALVLLDLDLEVVDLLLVLDLSLVQLFNIVNEDLLPGFRAKLLPD
jgi:hypothetical protein